MSSHSNAIDNKHITQQSPTDDDWIDGYSGPGLFRGDFGFPEMRRQQHAPWNATTTHEEGESLNRNNSLSRGVDRETAAVSKFARLPSPLSEPTRSVSFTIASSSQDNIADRE